MNLEKYILYADDDPDDCFLLNRAITRQDKSVKVHTETTGDDAVAFLQASLPHHPPGLIILDINMPRMNGLDAFNSIRTLLPFYIPIIFLTTAPRDADVIYGESHGATVMRKPKSIAEYDELASMILELFLSNRNA